MDVVTSLSREAPGAITCVETHTVGMPCRIAVNGFECLSGSLAFQKAQAAEKHDHLRKHIIFEPRGHFGMFGAALRPETDKTESGDAHMGVLYMHSGGYSNTCGHATMAVCRFLVDTHDLAVFPKRRLLQYDQATRTVSLTLDTPGGLIKAKVPTTPDGSRSDTSRPISIALSSYVLASDLRVRIQEHRRWPELGERSHVSVALAYCSAFHCQITLEELGFPPDSLQGAPPLDAFKFAAAQLKKALADPCYEGLLRHPVSGEPGSIFGVLVMAKGQGKDSQGSKGVETGQYIFADGVLDKSPTGSLSAARTAVAFARGDMAEGDLWTYQSLISNHLAQGQGFTTELVAGKGRKKLDEGGYAAGPVTINVRGHVYYTGVHVCSTEEHDPLGMEGFDITRVGRP